MKINPRKFFALTACLAMVVCFANPGCASRKQSEVKIPARVSTQDVQYLKDLARDTWNCIDFMVNEDTQLPYDTIKKTEWTSVSNIGVYVASLSAAVDMGFITREQAKQRLEKLLTNLNSLNKWNGFSQCWNSVKTGVPAAHDTWLSTLDAGNYYAGLTVGRAYFPELKDAFSGQIDIADWSKLYNPETRRLRFGYNFNGGKFGGDLNDLGADSRLASFLAVATGKVPVESWKNLSRDMEERYGYQYLQPGWQGGGLFMQYISGLMLDERHTFVGLSAANFAFAQILHARKNNFPVWGWSACEAPTGEYLGSRALKDEIVTPHASVLAINHYPALVIANLKKLEEMGARQPYEFNGEKKAFGFRDSINIHGNVVANDYLLLDQCMLFLSLANFADDGFVWKTFRKDKAVQNGYEQIADLQPVDYDVLPAKAPGLAAAKPEEKAANVFDVRDTQAGNTQDPFARIIEPGHFLKNFIVKGNEHTVAVHAGKVTLDGDLSEWGQAVPVVLTPKKDAEVTKLTKDSNQGGTFYFMWDEKYLYFAAKVQADDLVFTQTNGEIWKDNVIELFMSPNAHDFGWGRRDCYQIGLAASGPDKQPQVWAWFQDGPTDKIKLASKTGDTLIDGKRGYIVEAAIEWSFLKTVPKPGVIVGASPAFHFVDAKRENEMKLNWCFMPDGKSLGELELKK
jgi:hypothetical protein